MSDLTGLRPIKGSHPLAQWVSRESSWTLSQDSWSRGGTLLGSLDKRMDSKRLNIEPQNLDIWCRGSLFVRESKVSNIIETVIVGINYQLMIPQLSQE